MPLRNAGIEPMTFLSPFLLFRYRNKDSWQSRINDGPCGLELALSLSLSLSLLFLAKTHNYINKCVWKTLLTKGITMEYGYVLTTRVVEHSLWDSISLSLFAHSILSIHACMVFYYMIVYLIVLKVRVYCSELTTTTMYHVCECISTCKLELSHKTKRRLSI